MCWLFACRCFLARPVANCLRMDTQSLWREDGKTRKWSSRRNSSQWHSVCNLSGVGNRITLGLAQLEKRQFTTDTGTRYRNTALSVWEDRHTHWKARKLSFHLPPFPPSLSVRSLRVSQSSGVSHILLLTQLRSSAGPQGPAFTLQVTCEQIYLPEWCLCPDAILSFCSGPTAYHRCFSVQIMGVGHPVFHKQALG